MLLGPDGKVRGDHDLVFYNHPAQDGVSVEGTEVTADLSRLPAGEHRVVMVVSADPLQPGAVITRAPQLTISQSAASSALFIAPDFTSGETVVVLAELYRRGHGWKARAVGPGYASGLAGLRLTTASMWTPSPPPRRSPRRPARLQDRPPRST
ncbi:TerD family protein [Streptomyces niveus]